MLRTLSKLADLLLVDIGLILLAAIITFFPSNILRIVLGVPMAVFLPGYVLVAALFPKSSLLSGAERLVLSVGLSVGIVSFTGIFLNMTSWGIRIYPVLICLVAFILTTSAIAMYRRYTLGEGEHMVSPNLSLSFWKNLSLTNRVLSVGLILAILSALVMLVYMVVVPKLGEHFTEFYVLGPGGRMENYPEELSVGQEITVRLVIVNHEYEDVSYRVEVRNATSGELPTVKLAYGQKWDGEVSFKIASPGEEQKVEFVLYKGTEAYRQLSLWVNVAA